MTLDWRLTQKEVTIKDLSDKGENLFPFLTFMMATGVPDLKTRSNVEKFQQRSGQFVLAEGLESAEDTLVWLHKYSEECWDLGLATNVSTISPTKFNKRVLEMLDNRRKSIVKHHLAKEE